MSKIIKLLAVLPAIFLSVSLSAQKPLGKTEDYRIKVPQLVEFTGKRTYSYFVSDDGEKIMSGPISIVGKLDWSYNNYFYQGTYNLTASTKNGYMNGPMSVQAKYHGWHKYKSGSEDYAFSFKGNFNDGLPEGSFVAKASDYGTLSVNYRKGVLVGSYSVQGGVHLSGTLDDKGRMTGKWRKEYFGDVTDWEFMNGVMVRVSSKTEESTPAQVEMAKKYASKAIDKTELESQGYVVCRDSIKLGGYVNDFIFKEYIAQWKDLGWYDFTPSLWVSYEYLYNLLPIPESEMEIILREISYQGECKSYPRIEFDDKAKSYTLYYPDYKTNAIYHRRFTNKQMERIHDALDAYNRTNPTSLDGYLYNNFGRKYGVDAVGEVFDSIKKEKDPFKATDSYSKLLSSLKEMDTVVDKVSFEGREITSDGKYYVTPLVGLWNQPSPFSFRYVPVSVLDDFRSLEKEILGYGPVLEHYAADYRMKEASRLLDGVIDMAGKASDIETVAKEMEGFFVTAPSNYMSKTHWSVNATSREDISSVLFHAVSGNLKNVVVEDTEYKTFSMTADIVCQGKKGQFNVPVTLSMFNGKIINGTVVIPSIVLEQAKKDLKKPKRFN